MTEDEETFQHIISMLEYANDVLKILVENKHGRCSDADTLTRLYMLTDAQGMSLNVDVLGELDGE